ncbi:uncharacterized protein LOC112505552, partial [Cynara cardunculus var. scolymus]|uniref:uncharacterized protein LOC112505550 n=1 Tax=Cynara cardunculus var. scolymus TaxID=59895 RepID=UPI000D62F275
MSDEDLYRQASQSASLRNEETFIDHDMASMPEAKQSQRKSGKAARSNGSSSRGIAEKTHTAKQKAEHAAAVAAVGRVQKAEHAAAVAAVGRAHKAEHAAVVAPFGRTQKKAEHAAAVAAVGRAQKAVNAAAVAAAGRAQKAENRGSPSYCLTRTTEGTETTTTA